MTSYIGHCFSSSESKGKLSFLSKFFVLLRLRGGIAYPPGSTVQWDSIWKCFLLMYLDVFGHTGRNHTQSKYHCALNKEPRLELDAGLIRGLSLLVMWPVLTQNCLVGIIILAGGRFSFQNLSLDYSSVGTVGRECCTSELPTDGALKFAIQEQPGILFPFPLSVNQLSKWEQWV